MDSDEATTVCKRDALGRVKAPKAQREALLDEFERSSLSGVQFARAAVSVKSGALRKKWP